MLFIYTQNRQLCCKVNPHAGRPSACSREAWGFSSSGGQAVLGLRRTRDDVATSHLFINKKFRHFDVCAYVLYVSYYLFAASKGQELLRFS